MALLIVLLVLLVIFGLPRWRYSQGWGYAPSSVLGVILLILLVLWLTGYIR